MENDAIADEILAALEALMQAAGPEWTLEAMNALLQEVQGGGQQPEMVSQGGPGAMPPMGGAPQRRNALAQ